MMDAERWSRVQTLFDQCLELDDADRRAFLERACDGDEQICTDVLALLQEDARANGFLDSGLAEAAQKIFAQPFSPLSGPQDFGPYRIVRLLGEGGMGVVFLAERADLGSSVAIKILRDSWLSPARRERFAAEQRTLAQLNHPGIARLYDADTLPDGTPWFAMEYVEGLPITAYCRENNCSIPQRLELFRAICAAVLYAHGNAVIHRDLKPSNILVKSDGSIRLLDFGIAKHLRPEGATADQTRTLLRLMTPIYAAPEQILGAQVDIRADVYSLGTILYELLAGSLPFNLADCTPAQAERVILEQDPEKPSAVVRRTDAARFREVGKASWDDLDILCLAAIRKDPDRRYRSVEALIRDIDHYLRNEPLEARPDRLTYRLRKFARRNRKALAASVAIAFTLAALVVFFTIRLTSARNAALVQAARAQRIQDFTLSLFQGEDKLGGPARDLKAITLVDRGVQEARMLNRDPEVQAEFYQTLGAIYENLGNFDQADSLLQSALQERKSRFGPDDPETAQTLITLGLMRARQGRLADAERLVQQGLEIDRRRLPPSDPRIAKALFALGFVAEDRGAYKDAIKLLDESVRLESAAGATPDLAAALAELANSHFYTGDYEISEALNRRALAMNRQLHGDRHPLIADTLINLGAIKFNEARYAEAETFDRQALDINEHWYGPEHPETASSLTVLGQALVYQNRFDEGEQALNRALTIQEHVYGPVHVRVAFVLNELGRLSLEHHDLDQAEARYRRAASIYRSVYGEGHYTVALMVSNLAGVYMARKQYARAEKIYADALDRFTKALSANHQNTAITQIKLGRALIAQNRFADAEPHTLAGYAILQKKRSAPEIWRQNARKDLTTIYAALHEPEKAAALRASK